MRTENSWIWEDPAMKNCFFVLALVAFAASACATRVIHLPDGRVAVSREAMPQVGVILSVRNNCAAFLVVESGGIPRNVGLPFGKSDRIPISTSAYSGLGYRTIEVLASAQDAQGRYLGSITERFDVDTYRGTYERTWVVDRLDSPPGARCDPPRVP